MIRHTQSIPDAGSMLRVWTPFKELVGVTSVHTPEEHERALALIDSLLAEIGDDESHPLAEMLEYLANQVRSFEDEHVVVPDAKPGEVLRFLMEEHGLRQEELDDCAPQSRISDILSGKRAVSRTVAKKLAARFKVRADLFL